MRIGIDISQVAYKKTGVANYLKNLVEGMIAEGKDDDFVLFFSSMRGKIDYSFINGLKSPRVKIKTFKYPPRLLDFLWNKLHIFPIEYFIGDLDVFITSDWTEPPVKNAQKATIIYDMVVYKYPQETAKVIRDVQKRKLKWVKKESDIIFTISESAKLDIVEILKIPAEKIQVIYPGLTL
jgi:glycosyltransferase involved in cell wall biosynthesis